MAGVRNRALFVYPLTNADHSPTAYTVAPEEHFGALMHAERNGWELIGAFHSHPRGPDELSATDLALASEPGWFYLVVTAEGVGAFRIAERRATRIEIVPHPARQ